MKSSYRFLKVPLCLFSDSYSQLSVEAKILYAFLLDRLTLSEKNGFLLYTAHFKLSSQKMKIAARSYDTEQNAVKLKCVMGTELSWFINNSGSIERAKISRYEKSLN